MFCIEEFHSLVPKPNIGLMHNTIKKALPHFNLKILMRTGRSYGINYMIAPNEPFSDDVPGTIKTGITTWCALKQITLGCSHGNLPAAADIPSGFKGRCIRGWLYATPIYRGLKVK